MLFTKMHKQRRHTYWGRFILQQTFEQFERRKEGKYPPTERKCARISQWVFEPTNHNRCAVSQIKHRRGQRTICQDCKPVHTSDSNSDSETRHSSCSQPDMQSDIYISRANDTTNYIAGIGKSMLDSFKGRNLHVWFKCKSRCQIQPIHGQHIFENERQYSYQGRSHDCTNNFIDIAHNTLPILSGAWVWRRVCVPCDDLSISSTSRA